MLTAKDASNKMASGSPRYDPVTLAERPPDWPEDPIAFVKSNGWRYDDPADTPTPERRWHDPRTGGKARKVQVGERTFDGGRYKEPIYQTYGPAADWWYSLAEAVALQLERDRNERVTGK